MRLNRSRRYLYFWCRQNTPSVACTPFPEGTRPIQTCVSEIRLTEPDIELSCPRICIFIRGESLSNFQELSGKNNARIGKNKQRYPLDSTRRRYRLNNLLVRWKKVTVKPRSHRLIENIRSSHATKATFYYSEFGVCQASARSAQVHFIRGTQTSTGAQLKHVTVNYLL